MPFIRVSMFEICPFLSRLSKKISDFFSGLFSLTERRGVFLFHGKPVLEGVRRWRIVFL
jgi:hypothetical protein